MATLLAPVDAPKPLEAGARDWPRNDRKKGWLGRDHTKEDFCLDLGKSQLDAIRRLVADIRTRTLQIEDVALEDFSAPELDPFLADMVRELKSGKGLVFLRGLPASDLSEDDLRLIYWGIGLHVGKPLVQSFQGDRLGEIRVNPSNIARPYQNSIKLPLHCALMDFFSMMGVRKAKTGGANIFGSSLAIWEIMQAERPDLFAILSGNLHIWDFITVEPHASIGMPIFGETDGVRSVVFTTDTPEGPPGNSAEEREALRFFREINERDDVRLSADLKPGEMVFINNFEVMHARTEFVDWTEPAKRRLLFRLWLQPDTPRPRIPQQQNLLAKLDPALGINPGSEH
jgi:hypothetical protein